MSPKGNVISPACGVLLLVQCHRSPMPLSKFHNGTGIKNRCLQSKEESRGVTVKIVRSPMPLSKFRNGRRRPARCCGASAGTTGSAPSARCLRQVFALLCAVSSVPGASVKFLLLSAWRVGPCPCRGELNSAKANFWSVPDAFEIIYFFCLRRTLKSFTQNYAQKITFQNHVFFFARKQHLNFCQIGAMPKFKTRCFSVFPQANRRISR